ncbi:MAG: putative PDDEXK endonuclease [archaeon]
MTANTPRSRKTKGQKFQKDIVNKLREHFELDSNEDDCFNGDITARLMGGSGTDIILSPKAKELIPFDIEAKAQEKTNPFEWIKQAHENSSEDRIPLVIFKRNRSKPYCIISLDDLLYLFKNK